MTEKYYKYEDGERKEMTGVEVEEYLAKIAKFAPTPQRLAMQEITRLESLETHRRLAEAAAGIDDGWLATNRELIAIQREIINQPKE